MRWLLPAHEKWANNNSPTASHETAGTWKSKLEEVLWTDLDLLSSNLTLPLFCVLNILPISTGALLGFLSSSTAWFLGVFVSHTSRFFRILPAGKMCPALLSEMCKICSKFDSDWSANYVQLCCLPNFLRIHPQFLLCFCLPPSHSSWYTFRSVR